MKTESRFDIHRFAEVGFAGPVDVLTGEECDGFLWDAELAPEPLDWWKGRAATSRAFYEIAIKPAILDNVERILGPNVILWGADIVTRRPGEEHPWHSDIESARPGNRTVAVWLGLENTSRESSLQLIPYSHKFGQTIQEARHDAQRRREDVTAEEILTWSRNYDERADLVQLDIRDGQALFFDGRLWHGSMNLQGSTRRALLLQYATPGSPIRIPDPQQVDWPFKDGDYPPPACLLVRGVDDAKTNRIVPAPPKPPAGALARLGPTIKKLQVPLEPNVARGWKPYPIFEGSAPHLRSFESHASVLTQGNSPHPPHTHAAEEVLLLLSGEVELELPDLDQPRRRLMPGEFVYYPTRFPHTLTALSEEPANYLMFKWERHEALRHEALPFGHYRTFDPSSEVEEGFHAHKIFEGPTAHLNRVHCHSSTITPGAGYPKHADPYDVVIVVLEGEIRTLGQRIGPYGVVYFPAGVEHGMKGEGDRPARYLVFEFEAPPDSLL